jgi:chemotaxis protein MotA
MKATTLIGIALAGVLLMLAVLMEGGSPASFISIPAFLIVIGGTTGAVMASGSMRDLLAMPKLTILAFKGGEIDAKATSRTLLRLAQKARRDGLLALERDLDELDDAFARKGLQLVIDGADSNVVDAILRSEMDWMTTRHARNAKLFAQAGGFAPTLGILGTVMSLVHVLENLDSPATLGKSIAGAFLATLYGVGSANLLFLPIANRLKGMAEEESVYREMLIDGVLSIQAGDNPRLLAEKLETFIAPIQRGEEPEPAPSPAAIRVESVEQPA